MSQDGLTFSIHLDTGEGDAEEADRQTRQLLHELREQPEVRSAELEHVPGPPGSKGLIVSSILVVMAAASNAALKNALEHMIDRIIRRRRANAVVKFNGSIGGRKFQFEGPPEQFATLLATFEANPSGRR